jgi:hypothetical protein
MMPDVIAVDWGPVAAWAGTGATICIALVTASIALGYLSQTRPPGLRATFEPTEPWVRNNHIGGEVFWVRIGVENVGPQRTAPARGCVGRVVAVRTGGVPRYDVDTVQLRWASLPHVRGFEPMDVRNGQREFLDVVALRPGQPWRIITFDEPGWDPGFVLDLSRDGRHEVDVAVFSDNATTVTTTVVLAVGAGGGEAVVASG